MHALISPAWSLRHAFDFACTVWRRAWAIQLLAAIGPTLLFVAHVGFLDSETAADLFGVGLALTVVTIAPLMGALLRLRLGGAAEGQLGPGGLQLGLGETRLIAALSGGLVAGVFALLPLVAISALILVVFRGLGMVDLGGSEPVPVSFFLVFAAAAAVAAVWLYGLVRLALSLPACVDRQRFSLAEAWRAGAGAEGALATGLLFSLAPAAVVLAIGVWLDRFNGALLWAWEDAAVAGALFFGVMTFVQAPLTLGLLGGVYLLLTERPVGAPFRLRRLEKVLAAVRA